MNAIIARFAAISIFTLGLTANAIATPITLTATLTGPNESPPNSSLATGFAKVVYDGAAHTLGLNVSFSGLSGADTAAHIHCCTIAPFTGTAGVATAIPVFPGFPIPVTSGTYSHLFDLTQADFWNPSFVTAHGGTPQSAEAFFAPALLLGETYLNIHTENNTGGEIRGFLVETPEPATLALVGAGLFVVGGLGMRRKRKGRVAK